MKGVDDLDFYIGDEAVDKPTYSTKVLQPLMSQQIQNVWESNYPFGMAEKFGLFQETKLISC